MSAAAQILRKGRPITLRRFADGTYVDGFYTEDQTPVDTTIIASVQPMGYKEKMLLPEGDRVKQWIKIYTVEPVRTQEGDARADRLVVDGKEYDVQQVTDWMLPGPGANLTHYEIAAVSVNEKTKVV